MIIREIDHSLVIRIITIYELLMTIAHTNAFLPKDLLISSLAKAIAHPARLIILRRLVRQKHVSSSELSRGIPLAPSTVSQHLSALKKMGLIGNEADGLHVFYHIEKKKLSLLKSAIQHLVEIDFNFEHKTKAGSHD